MHRLYYYFVSIINIIIVALTSLHVTCKLKMSFALTLSGEDEGQMMMIIIIIIIIRGGGAKGFIIINNSIIIKGGGASASFFSSMSLE